jgi:hypothetical protein
MRAIFVASQQNLWAGGTLSDFAQPMPPRGRACFTRFKELVIRNSLIRLLCSILLK